MELVVCVTTERTLVETCPYKLTGGETVYVERDQYHLVVTVYEAQSGKKLADTVLDMVPYLTTAANKSASKRARPGSSNMDRCLPQQTLSPGCGRMSKDNNESIGGNKDDTEEISMDNR